MTPTKKGIALGFNFARIVRQLRVSREFLSDTKVKVISPGGFPYEAFNGKAQITPWSLLRMVEFSRGASFNKFEDDDHCFLDVDKIYTSYLMFIVASKIEISPQMYDYSVPKSPVEILVELDNVGKSSFGLKTSVYLPGVNQPVCESLVQSVFIDVKTRKPSSPPEWWREKYAINDENKVPFKVARQILPKSGFLTNYQVRICASDLDTYWHTNWTNFVRFTYDAFINHGVKKHGAKNIGRGFRRPKAFSVFYAKEANLLDTLDVIMWKDAGDVNGFKFQFLRGSEVVCESEMELFPHSDESL